MQKKGFLSYYFSMFVAPRRTFIKLLADERCLRFGFNATLIPDLGYTLFYIMASQVGGAPSTFKPWLAIPAEDYFYWDIYLSIPGVLISIICASGIIQLLSRLFKNSGVWINPNFVGPSRVEKVIQDKNGHVSLAFTEI